MKRIPLFLLISSIFLLISCNTSNQTLKQEQQYSKKVEENTLDIFNLNGGFELSLKENNSLTEKNLTFIINENKFSPDVELLNDYEVSSKYRLFFLVDYNQVNVKYNGESKESIDINLEPYSKELINVTFEDLKTGTHDLIIMVIREPDYFVEEREFIPGSGRILKRRATLIVKENSIETVDYHYLPTTNNEMITDSPFLTKKINEPLSNIKTRENYTLNFYNQNEDSNYAIVSILNNKQVNITSRFITIRETGLVEIPFSIPSMTSETKNNLNIILFESPFETLEDEDGNLLQVNWRTYPSNLITIKN
ncbi:hypothetical protein [Sutcliffiella horikoshii]|uniref:hypothetical protein n=1 Tax=Sutcliffiella horikoshii TaxID=79883 RepID=UPI001CFD4B58|nr:hypothetical protein [Sutcliffiella horikoshii]